MLQDVTNRSSEIGFHKAKKKRAVEGGRRIFRPTVNRCIMKKLIIVEIKLEVRETQDSLSILLKIKIVNSKRILLGEGILPLVRYNIFAYLEI